MKRSRQEARVKRDVKRVVRGKRRRKRSRKEAKAVSWMTPSSGHVCFAGYNQTRDRLGMLTPLDYDDVTKDDFEVFVGPHGHDFYKAPMKFGLEDDDKLGRVRKGRFCTQSGAWQILELCKTNGFPAPAATTALMDKQHAVNEMYKRQAVLSGRRRAPGRNKQGHGSSEKGNGMSRHANKDGKSLAECWVNLFIENEKLARKGKALTDAKLIKAMQKMFPEKKEIKSILRVDRQRILYNEGRYKFEKFGKAKKQSYRYDDGKHAVDEQAEKKAEKEKAKKEKKSSKKNGKKSSRKEKAKAKKDKAKKEKAAKKEKKSKKSKKSSKKKSDKKDKKSSKKKSSKKKSSKKKSKK